MGLNQEMARLIPQGPTRRGPPPPPRQGSPIGVPPGWLAQRGGPRADAGNLLGTGPRYFDGDEHEPARWDDPQVQSLQQRLVGAGLLKPGFRPGFYDKKTRSAYKTLLGYANQEGMAWDEWLVGAEAGEFGPGGGGGRGRAPDYKTPFVRRGFIQEAYQPPDYDTLKQLVRQTFTDFVGRTPADHEMVLLANEMQGDARRQYDVEMDAARKNHTAQQREAAEAARVGAGISQVEGSPTDVVEDHTHDVAAGVAAEAVDPQAELMDWLWRNWGSAHLQNRYRPENEQGTNMARATFNGNQSLMGGGG